MLELNLSYKTDQLVGFQKKKDLFMKIAVLMKQVPNEDAAIKIDSGSTSIIEDNVTFITNEPDTYALEEALLMKDQMDNIDEVVVCTMGAESSLQTIKDALAKGADRGIHIEENGDIETDPLSIAKSLSSALKEENFDLILTGLQSDDTGMGQTGVLVGELLNMSTATLAIETDIDEEKIRVKRELESGWFQWVKFPLPASISIQSGLNTPRYPSLRGIMGAKKKEIKVISPSDHQTGSISQSIDKVFVPQTSKQTEIIEGDADSAVIRIVEILKSDIKVL